MAGAPYTSGRSAARRAWRRPARPPAARQSTAAVPPRRRRRRGGQPRGAAARDRAAAGAAAAPGGRGGAADEGGASGGGSSSDASPPAAATPAHGPTPREDPLHRLRICCDGLQRRAARRPPAAQRGRLQRAELDPRRPLALAAAGHPLCLPVAPPPPPPRLFPPPAPGKERRRACGPTAVARELAVSSSVCWCRRAPTRRRRARATSSSTFDRTLAAAAPRRRPTPRPAAPSPREHRLFLLLRDGARGVGAGEEAVALRRKGHVEAAVLRRYQQVAEAVGEDHLHAACVAAARLAEHRAHAGGNRHHREGHRVGRRVDVITGEQPSATGPREALTFIDGEEGEAAERFEEDDAGPPRRRLQGRCRQEGHGAERAGPRRDRGEPGGTARTRLRAIAPHAAGGGDAVAQRLQPLRSRSLTLRPLASVPGATSARATSMPTAASASSDAASSSITRRHVRRLQRSAGMDKRGADRPLHRQAADRRWSRGGGGASTAARRDHGEGFLEGGEGVGPAEAGMLRLPPWETCRDAFASPRGRRAVCCHDPFDRKFASDPRHGRATSPPCGVSGPPTPLRQVQEDPAFGGARQRPRRRRARPARAHGQHAVGAAAPRWRTRSGRWATRRRCRTCARDRGSGRGLFRHDRGLLDRIVDARPRDPRRDAGPGVEVAQRGASPRSRASAQHPEGAVRTGKRSTGGERLEAAAAAAARGSRLRRPGRSAAAAFVANGGAKLSAALVAPVDRAAIGGGEAAGRRLIKTKPATAAAATASAAAPIISSAWTRRRRRRQAPVAVLRTRYLDKRRRWPSGTAIQEHHAPRDAVRDKGPAPVPPYASAS